MTTVHLTNAYHATSGGIRTFYHALLDAANRERRRVVLVVPGERDETRAVGDHGCIHFVKAPLAPAFDRRYRLLMPWAYAPLIGGPIAVILAREQPALVEICDKYSLPYLAAMLRKRWHPQVPRPVLVGVSAERFDDNMAAYLSAGPLARAFTRWYIRHVYGPPFDVHVANSAYVARELTSALPDRPRGFIRICPLGVDIAHFGPDRFDASLRQWLLAEAGGTTRTVLLLYAGRVSPEKNIPLLVDTLRTLAGDAADYRLIVAGDGPRADWLRDQASGALAGRIVLLGNLDRATLAACYASCDVFVHPNPREPFGIGPLEAMASGVPVVAPDAGGLLEYAGSHNAWLAAPAPAAFAAAIRGATRSSPRIATALATAREFSWELVTQRHFALYDELVGARPPGLRRLDAVVTAG